jgi:hypothetical protein
MADDSDSYVPGPLDQLVPGLRQKVERTRALPVHPRVVHARAPAAAPADEERTIVLASFAAPASVRALHAALKPLVEAALLSELSRPAAELREDPSQLNGVELYTFVAASFEIAPALSPFALERVSLDHPHVHTALALLRREARLVEPQPPDEPLARYRAPFARSAHPLAAPLASALREAAPPDPWGSQPGVLARSCADRLSALGYPGVEPTRQGIERLEAVVLGSDYGVVRWMEPLLFQALCDLVAVAAAATYGRPVQWGVCEPDPETQLSPPPVLLVERDGDSFHVPLGEHVLRWCVMPSAIGESIPSLGAWAEHEFT